MSWIMIWARTHNGTFLHLVELAEKEEWFGDSDFLQWLLMGKEPQNEVRRKEVSASL